MVEVKRKPNESVETMLRRFSELLKKERKLDEAKEKKFYVGKKSKSQIKKEALIRKKYQARKKYLKKIGILK